MDTDISNIISSTITQKMKYLQAHLTIHTGFLSQKLENVDEKIKDLNK